MTQFNEFGLSNAVLRSISAIGYEEPTPIQRDAIPVVMDGHDIMGLAQTGTGKTAAFGLPLVHHLLKDDRRPQPKAIGALIVAPTRELVNQIAENLREFTRKTPLKVNLVVGGASIHVQKRKLEKGTDILVATPGRLMDLIERKAVFIDSARYLVLDEADQMLDLGFIHVLRRIAKMVGKPRQTLLFSATMPKQIEELSRSFLDDPVRIEVARSGKAADKVSQSVHFVGQGDKSELLRKCLAERKDDLSLVFSRTKHGAEKLMKRLVAWGFAAGSIHGNKSQGQRERAIRAFKSGEIRILVATDVAARGIDIPGVSHVYNFDLPEVPENYIHRIGRTARAGREGEAVAFCAPAELHLLSNVEKLMGIDIDVASGIRPEYVKPAKKSGGRNSRGGTSGRNGRGQKQSAPRRSRNRHPVEDGKFDNRATSNVSELIDAVVSGEDREQAINRNHRPGRKKKPAGGGQGDRVNTGRTSKERSQKPGPKRENTKFRGRAGKKRGRKNPVAA
ncbi:MAG: DEAD/DEAH box helicase [Hyphomicrobiales bacterium]|nr:DEAD/DEAH box helicase [Hyphomicrobiales bacterium]